MDENIRITFNKRGLRNIPKQQLATEISRIIIQLDVLNNQDKTSDTTQNVQQPTMEIKIKKPN